MNVVDIRIVISDLHSLNKEATLKPACWKPPRPYRLVAICSDRIGQKQGLGRYHHLINTTNSMVFNNTFHKL